MPDSSHGALSGPCSGLCGAAGHLVTVRFQGTLNFSRCILSRLRHFHDCCRHDLVQLLSLVFVETGAGNMLDAATKDAAREQERVRELERQQEIARDAHRDRGHGIER